MKTEGDKKPHGFHLQRAETEMLEKGQIFEKMSDCSWSKLEYGEFSGLERSSTQPG